MDLSVKIIEATTLRDGGTTIVTMEDGGVVRDITFEYTLPWDGRTRYVYVSDHNSSWVRGKRLAINSPEEIRILGDVRTAAEERYGLEIVEDFYNHPEGNPGEGMWSYVFNFLRIAAMERTSD